MVSMTKTKNGTSEPTADDRRHGYALAAELGITDDAAVVRLVAAISELRDQSYAQGFDAGTLRADRAGAERYGYERGRTEVAARIAALADAYEDGTEYGQTVTFDLRTLFSEVTGAIRNGGEL